MKKLRDVKRLLGLCGQRAFALQQKVAHQRDELAGIDGEIAKTREAVEVLKERLLYRADGKPYARSELMRERGRQAVVRMQITEKRMEETDLLGRRQGIEQEIAANANAVLALERRRSKHGDWLKRQRCKRDQLRESRAETEIMEGNRHGFDNQD